MLCVMSDPIGWDAVGALAELLGAIAVFITLAYLALQIRQNTKAVRSAAVDASINSVMNVRGMMAQDAELAEIFRRGNENPDSLDALESYRHRALLQNVAWSAWNVYSQAKYSDGGIWEPQKAVLQRVFGSPGGRRFLQEHAAEFDHEFLLEVQNAVGERSDT